MTTTRASRGGVLWWHTTENLSPRVTPGFLPRQRKLLLPQQYAMEHENTWVDAADSFTSAAEVDAAMGGDWTEDEHGAPGVRYVMAVDLGLVSDPSMIGVASLDQGLVCLNRLVTLQGSREHPVSMQTVERTVVDLAEAFPPARILIESWQGVSAAQSLARLGYPAEISTPSLKSNAEQWGVLNQLLTARRLAVPVHPQLRAELLGLQYEPTATGVRVTGGAPHQDHAVVVRMLAHALGAERPQFRIL
jgi:hypothetical protein